MTARIVTLTVNPALDIASTADAVRPTHKIRTRDERYDAGGGGVNVARVLHALGGDVQALLLVGDVTGQLIGELLDAEHVAWRAVPIGGRTRISYTVHEVGGAEYRFVPPGPQVQDAEWRALLDRLGTLDADWIVASGSLPPGVPDDFYARAARDAQANGRKFALDSSGAALRAALGQGVDLLKLSLGELEFLQGHPVPDAAAQEREVTALLKAGAARAIAVSLGGDGALLATADGLWREAAAPVAVRSAVGAGDSFLAGLVLALAGNESAPHALRMGTATAAVAVSQYGTALVRREDVMALYAQLAQTPQ